MLKAFTMLTDTREVALTLTRDQMAAELQKMFNPTGRDVGELQKARAHATKPDPARDRANATALLEKSTLARRQRAERLENARAWVEFHGNRAFLFHDLAARACEQRDKALALVEQLENGR